MNCASFKRAPLMSDGYTPPIFHRPKNREAVQQLDVINFARAARAGNTNGAAVKQANVARDRDKGQDKSVARNFARFLLAILHQRNPRPSFFTCSVARAT